VAKIVLFIVYTFCLKCNLFSWLSSFSFCFTQIQFPRSSTFTAKLYGHWFHDILWSLLKLRAFDFTKYVETLYRNCI